MKTLKCKNCGEDINNVPQSVDGLCVECNDFLMNIKKEEASTISKEKFIFELALIFLVINVVIYLLYDPSSFLNYGNESGLYNSEFLGISGYEIFFYLGIGIKLVSGITYIVFNNKFNGIVTMLTFLFPLYIFSIIWSIIVTIDIFANNKFGKGIHPCAQLLLLIMPIFLLVM